MSNFTVAQFNEAHQRAFGCAPDFGTPSKEGPDHCPVVSVSLMVGGYTPIIIGKGSNQKVARQNAVDQAIEAYENLPYELRRAIGGKREGF